MDNEKILTEKRFIEILDKRQKEKDTSFDKEVFRLWLLVMSFFIMAQVGAYMLGKYGFP